jgi:PhnB protein
MVESMSADVPSVPQGHNSIMPYLTVKDAARAIDFYVEAFGARELVRFAEPSGKIGHAEIQIGNSRLMLSDEYPQWRVVGPETLGGTSLSLMIYVDDADTVFARALRLGAMQVLPVADAFYGDRCGRLRDPFGHRWIIATHKREIPLDEMDKRVRELHGMALVRAASES